MGWSGETMVVPAAILTVGAAALMVTNFRFFSLKGVKLTERVPFRYIVFVVLILVLFSINPPLIFFLVFFAYALTGPIGALRRKLKKPQPAAA
jgi:CDP-diacylglycerol--serine O-phosphatidyltransferase